MDGPLFWLIMHAVVVLKFCAKLSLALLFYNENNCKAKSYIKQYLPRKSKKGNARRTGITLELGCKRKIFNYTVIIL